MKMKLSNADQRNKVQYICGKIPEQGTTRVCLWLYSFTTYVDLTPRRCAEGSYDLLIESTNAEWVGLNEVYEHFRLEHMTPDEWLREHDYVDGRKAAIEDYDSKVASLSKKERKLFNAASETVPMRAVPLALKAKLPAKDIDSGNVKGCLSVLRKKLGLLRLEGGYLRNPRPH